jgi:hypothetical protein
MRLTIWGTYLHLARAETNLPTNFLSHLSCWETRLKKKKNTVHAISINTKTGQFVLTYLSEQCVQDRGLVWSRERSCALLLSFRTLRRSCLHFILSTPIDERAGAWPCLSFIHSVMVVVMVMALVVVINPCMDTRRKPAIRVARLRARRAWGRARRAGGGGGGCRRARAVVHVRAIEGGRRQRPGPCGGGRRGSGFDGSTRCFCTALPGRRARADTKHH